MQVFRKLEKVPASLGSTVVSVGNFDGVHVAHQAVVKHMAERAHAIGGKAVAVTFDPHPLRILRPDSSPRLLTPLDVKLQLLKQTGVDAVLVLPFTRDLSLMSAHDFARNVLVEALHAREVHEGYNFHFGHKAQGNVDTLAQFGREMGFDVHTYSEQLLRGHHVSSSEIRSLIAAGRVERARARVRHALYRSDRQPGALQRTGSGQRRIHHAHADQWGMFRRCEQCWCASDVWARLVRHREPPAELPSHRAAGTDRN